MWGSRFRNLNVRAFGTCDAALKLFMRNFLGCADYLYEVLRFGGGDRHGIVRSTLGAVVRAVHVLLPGRPQGFYARLCVVPAIRILALNCATNDSCMRLEDRPLRPVMCFHPFNFGVHVTARAVLCGAIHLTSVSTCSGRANFVTNIVFCSSAVTGLSKKNGHKAVGLLHGAWPWCLERLESSLDAASRHYRWGV